MEVLVWYAVYALLVAVASGSAPASGFGAPGFVQPATADAPATVTGASFVKAGGQYFDVNTGIEISIGEAKQRAANEGQNFPG